jgi:CheY-like chemotaxis protein
MLEQIEQNITLIMLIDDTREDLYINNRMIEKYGVNHKVTQFSMGTDAMEFLRENKENIDIIPDIIFLDIHMPQMNGFEFLVAYEDLPDAVKAKSKVYILSSTFDTEDIEKANSNPYVAHFYEKPLTKPVVELVVNNLKSGRV